MNPLNRLLAMGAAVCAVGVGCVQSTRQSAQGLFVAGKVTDEAGMPVARATITVGSVTATTDAQGAYSLTPAAKLGDAGVASVAADGFGRRTQPLTFEALTKTVDFVLRHNDTQTTVSMPAAGEAPAKLTASRGEGGFTLSIGAGSLIKPDGTPVNGTFHAALTYWHPNEALDHAPAPLYGTDAADAATGMVSLLSYGMADIVLTQGNDTLQVAPGKTLELTFALPSVYADAIANTAIDAADAPHLWVADEASGLWSRVGDQKDGTLSYDATARVMVAHLPHLSSWNLDGKMTTNACVRGRLVDCHQNPVANAQAWLWVMGKGQVGHWPIVTAADGSFCSNIAGTSRDIRKNGNAYDSSAYVWVSAPKKPAASACNPTGIDNVSELCAQGRGSSTICVTDEETGGKPFYAAGVAKCGTPSPELKSCGFCEGSKNPGGRCTVRDSRNTSGDGTPGTSFNVGYTSGSCTVLGDMVLPVGDCPNSDTPADSCAGKASTQGKVCATDKDCCPSTALECADAHCVPRLSKE